MKPCPNPTCSKPPQHRLYMSQLGHRSHVCCDCGAAGPLEADDAAAIAAWDTLPRRVQPRTGPVPRGTGIVYVRTESGTLRLANEIMATGPGQWWPAAEVDAMLGRK
jgi:hypothetical protein